MTTKIAFFLSLALGVSFLVDSSAVKAQGCYSPLNCLQLCNKVNTLDTELTTCQTKQAESDSALKTCENQQAELGSALETCQAKKDKLDSALTTCQAENKTITSELRQLEKYKTDFKELTAAHDAVLTELETQKTDLSDEQFKVKILFALLLISWAGAGALGWRQAQKNTTRKHSTGTKQIASPVKRSFNGTLRPDVPDSIGIAFQEKILDAVEHNQAWHSSWERAVQQGLQQLKNSDTSNRENIIAAFLMDFWSPLLACYETNTQQWQWFSTKFKAVCPDDWQAIIQTPSLKNKALSEVLNETDKVVGQGQQVKQLIRPVIILKNAQANMLAHRKAWVEME
jgi:hypothetical protein